MDLEFSRAPDAFKRLGVKQLPLVQRIPPNADAPAGQPLRLQESETMSPMKFQAYPWSPEDLLKFVQQREGLPEPIPVPEEPKFWQSPIFPFIAAPLLLMAAVGGYKIYYSPLVRFRFIYVLAGLAVYFFSVSGGMYNIIRGMPMTIFRDGGPQYFLQVRGHRGGHDCHPALTAYHR